MVLTRMRSEYDVWKPGEHNGTPRDYNPAFATGAWTLELFWSDGALQARTAALGERRGRPLTVTARRHGLPRPARARPGLGVALRPSGCGARGVRSRIP